ncbi:MAG TPA: CopD family protein, partial [Acetobacteraceae bacterium]|nr:CopD family protein [Acetobacteraceae bacterium]
MDGIGIATAVLRGMHMAALVSLFGTLLFSVAVLPEGARDRLRGMLRRLALVSALVALACGTAWLGVEAAEIAGADSVAMTLRAVPTVALKTQFGVWLLGRLALLLLVLPLLRFPWVGLVLAGAVLAEQPMLGHAGAVGGGAGAQLIASEALHLLASGAWLGALLPLYLAVGRLSHEDAAAACHNFTPVGLASVLLLAGTAVVQIGALMGGLPGLLGTLYGHIALVKLGLFLGLLALAAANRLVITERLAASDAGRRSMRLSISGEMVLGTAVVLTAGFLATQTPGTHEAPVWPFPWRPSLVAFADPTLGLELAAAVGAAVAGVALVVVGVAWRRARWPALGLAVAIEVVAMPYLDLLFVAAYPTSYFTSPTEFAATAIVSGGRIYTAHCAACHGAEGQGNGP